jgi:hypothetical protein
MKQLNRRKQRKQRNKYLIISHLQNYDQKREVTDRVQTPLFPDAALMAIFLSSDASASSCSILKYPFYVKSETQLETQVFRRPSSVKNIAKR